MATNPICEASSSAPPWALSEEIPNAFSETSASQARHVNFRGEMMNRRDFLRANSSIWENWIAYN
jgi:hypothetical protein